MVLYCVFICIVVFTNICTAVYCYRAGVAKYRTTNGSAAGTGSDLSKLEQAVDAAVSTGTEAGQKIQDTIDSIRSRGSIGCSGSSNNKGEVTNG